ncbi:MAG TPA: hypothetical protein VFO55_14240 [Gemmatimonadaceae bacterium]|nr:hypothetical protein [Gemmatimonadaceae bacterium]
MARQQQSTGSGLTPGQAVYVVDRLIRERKVSARDVSRMASEMRKEIADLEQRLAMLRSDSTPRARSGRPSAGARRAQRNVNPALAASRRLQGEYMGLMRHISGRDRARIKKIAAENGREAAVKEMRAHLGR